MLVLKKDLNFRHFIVDIFRQPSFDDFEIASEKLLKKLVFHFFPLNE